MLWEQYKTAGWNRSIIPPGPGGWWYHHAPTEDRARIQQHGLYPSLPKNNPKWPQFEVPDQPEGVYLTNSPEALKGVMFHKPMDTWRVPAQGLQVHPDPIVGERAVYTPQHLPNPELFRPYEKSNEYSNRWEPGYELPYESGPVPEDWVNYHDWHELGNPSDEEWESYGIGQDPETWRKAGWNLSELDNENRTDESYERQVPSPWWSGIPMTSIPMPGHDPKAGPDGMPTSYSHWHEAGTEPKPWEAKMFHGKPNSRGIMGPVRAPFWTTSFEDEAHGFAGGKDIDSTGSVHPVSVRFHNPAHFFAKVNWGPESLEVARQRGHDGVVVHWPANYDDPSDPYPPRTWAIALDPGTVVPGHLKDEVTDYD